MKLGFAFALSVGLASVMTGCVLSSGNVRTETRDLGSFSKIESTGSPDVEVNFGPKQTVSVTADDNILPLIETRVTGDTLMIGSTGSFMTTSISIGSYSAGSKGVKLNITVPALEGAKSTGSGNIVVNGVPGGHLKACVNGSGNITVNGTAEHFEAEINGSGNVYAAELHAKNVHVTVAGSGTAEVRASGRLDANVFGSGDVIYCGTPSEVNRTMGGSGNISQR
jgi:hypothetical protein